VFAPNAWWLVEPDFLPFQYVSDRAQEATYWYQYVAFPLEWTGGQIMFLLPAIGLLALLYTGRKSGAAGGASGAASHLLGDDFDRRYTAALALGPFAITTVLSALLGRLPIAMWGYPLWSFATLAALVWLGPVEDLPRLRRFAAGAIVVFSTYLVAYVAVELFEPLVRQRTKATQFPGAAMAAAVTRDWHDRFGTPLAYVCGSEFAANNVAVYSPDRPHVVVHCDPALAPWIDVAELRRRGMLMVAENGRVDASQFEQWGSVFGDLELQPAISLARQTLRPVPTLVLRAYVPPRP
jgi:hypothetical protein